MLKAKELAEKKPRESRSLKRAARDDVTAADAKKRGGDKRANDRLVHGRARKRAGQCTERTKSNRKKPQSSS